MCVGLFRVNARIVHQSMGLCVGQRSVDCVSFFVSFCGSKFSLLWVSGSVVGILERFSRLRFHHTYAPNTNDQ